MQHVKRWARRAAALSAVVMVGAIAAPCVANAEDAEPAKASTPLVLRAQGSFFLGGKNTMATGVETGAPAGCETCARGGHVTNEQMYVKYMEPLKERGTPVILVHGGGLTGAQYDTTPDGRMGWFEYFVRKGHKVFLPDQPGRGASGFDQAIYNKVRAGLAEPTEQAEIARTTDELAWSAFRFGPSFGVAFEDTQFPVEAAGELSKQGVPSPYALLSTPNPMYRELARLAARTKGGAVIVGHSQSGNVAFEAALANPRGVKGMIMIESGCPTYGEKEMKKLAKIPVLTIFGDHLGSSPDYPFQLLFDNCKKFIKELNSLGGNAKMLHPPSLGIKGNSHMLMQDRNNLQLADLIMKWMRRNVEK